MAILKVSKSEKKHFLSSIPPKTEQFFFSISAMPPKSEQIKKIKALSRDKMLYFLFNHILEARAEIDFFSEELKTRKKI